MSFLMGSCSHDNTQPATCSYMPLEKCFANVNGVLTPVNDGSGKHLHSCPKCDLEGPDKAQLRCECEAAKNPSAIGQSRHHWGTMANSTVDLREFFLNSSHKTKKKHED